MELDRYRTYIPTSGLFPRFRTMFLAIPLFPPSWEGTGDSSPWAVPLASPWSLPPPGGTWQEPCHPAEIPTPNAGCRRFP